MSIIEIILYTIISAFVLFIIIKTIIKAIKIKKGTYKNKEDEDDD